MKNELILKYFARVSTFMVALTVQIRFFQDIKLSIITMKNFKNIKIIK